MSVAAPLVLRPGDGARLRTLTRSAQAPAGHVQRARIVLLAADGVPNAVIGRQVGVSTPTVMAWRKRYEAGGVDALADLSRSGRPKVIDEVAVVVRTLSDEGRPPADLGAPWITSRRIWHKIRYPKDRNMPATMPPTGWLGRTKPHLRGQNRVSERSTFAVYAAASAHARWT
jgi:hypothetical protein